MERYESIDGVWTSKYEYENVFQKQDSSCIIVENGIPESDDIFDVAMAETKIKTDTQELPIFIEGGGNSRYQD